MAKDKRDDEQEDECPRVAAVRAIAEKEPFDTCPFCDGEVLVILVPPTVCHTQPVCARFSELDPIDYVRLLTAARKGDLPS